MERLDYTSRRNEAVDIAKFIGAICVVCIHTRLFAGISSGFDFLFTEVICRFAVPFFSICTAYYFAQKLEFNESGRLINSDFNRRLFIKTILRFLIMYLGWSFFYLLVLSFQWVNDGYLSISAYIGWFKSLLIGESYYHLWYPFQIIIGLLLLWPMLRLLGNHKLISISVLLWVLVTWCYVYGSVVPPDVSIRVQTIRTLMNSSIRLLPLLLIGIIISQNKDNQSKIWLGLFLLIALLFLVAEVLFLRRFGADHFSYILFTLPIGYFLFRTLLSLRITVRFDTRVLANSSMIIYFIHPAVLFFIIICGFDSTLFIGLLTIITSSVLGLIYACFRERGLLSNRK